MTWKKLLAGIALAAGVQASASAAIVTIDGAKFDISFDDAFIGLFGTPTIVGDVIQWFPSGSPGFTASTTTRDTTVITNSTFAFTIVADPGFFVTGGALTEAGDYLMFGAGSQVAATGQVRMTSLNPAAPTVIGAITPSTFSETSFPALETQNWDASGSVSVAATTAANVSIQNILVAYAGDAAGPRGAFIEKKEVFFSVSALPIPEPSTWAMFGVGVAMMGFALRKKMR
jgi:PEP-CTERM motif